MSDGRFGAQQSGANGEPVSQAEIDDVLNDERLSPSERLARLGELRQRVLDDRSAAGIEEYEPLRMRLSDAMSMLAEGGHDYDGSLRVEGEGAGGRGDPMDPAGDDDSPSQDGSPRR